jgi:hypothetical protein
MRLWYSPEGTIFSFRIRSDWEVCPIVVVSLYAILFPIPVMGSLSSTTNLNNAMLTQQYRGVSPYVGSAMAVLATLEQAQVLPPEGSREADRIIQYVIQFQSAFTKSSDRSLQDFARRAVAAKHGEKAMLVLEQFHANGWTAEMLDALSEADLHTPQEDMKRLIAGFEQFNVSVDDFKRFMQLIRDGRSALATQGQRFADVYARHRNMMPGISVR